MDLALIKQKAKSLAPSGNICMLLDTSGSMHGAPLEKLKEVCADFPDVKKWSFDSTVRPIDKVSDLYTRGTTRLDLALQMAISQGFREAVIITDGQPDSGTEGECYVSASRLKLHIIYVGPKDTWPEFLDKLAKASGGKFYKSSLDLKKEISTTIRALIGPSSIQL